MISYMFVLAILDFQQNGCYQVHPIQKNNTLQRWIELMYDDRFISKSYLYFMFTIEILAWQLAIALVIILGALNYVGFVETQPITATCTISYFQNKYSALAPMIQTAFVGSIIGMVSLTIIFIGMLIWVIRVCKEGNIMTSIMKTTRIGMYLLTNIAILGIIPPCGYYLTQIVELNNCASTYNQTQIIAIFVIAALLLLFALIYFVLIFKIILKESFSESKYRDLLSHPTEPHQVPQKTYQHYQQNNQYKNGSPQKRAGNRGEHVQNTKDNLLEDPSRSPKIVYNYKQRNPQNYDNFNEVKRHQSNKKSIQQSDILSRNAPADSSNYITPLNKAQIYGSRRQLPRIESDQEDFQIQHNRFMSKYQGGSVLPLRGVEEKSPYERKAGPSYLGSGQLNQNRHESPPRRLNRQQVILNHIKGKYAN